VAFQLDPLWLATFTAVFVACVLATLRRPGYGAAALAFITPFAAAHAVLGTTVSFSKAALLGVFVGLFSAPRAWTAIRRVPALPIVAAFATIIAVNLATLLVAQHRVEVLRESLKWLEYLAFFCAVFASYKIDPLPDTVRTALQLSIGLATLSALAELATGAHSVILVSGKTIPRIAGVLEGPNQFGGYLEVAMATIGAWHLRRPQRTSGALLFLTGFALVLSFSRAALAGTIVIALIFALVEGRRLFQLWPLITAYACAFAWTASTGAIDAFAVERLSDVNAGISGGVGNRSELWHAAIRLFLHHPLLGVGTGNYELDLPEAGLIGVRTQANNWYLQALAEGGALLLLATLAWIAVVVRALAARARISPWALAAFAATGAMIVHGIFDDLVFYPKVAEPWIVLIALGLAATRDDA
jgi:O-antigen ligase